MGREGKGGLGGSLTIFGVYAGTPPHTPRTSSTLLGPLTGALGKLVGITIVPNCQRNGNCAQLQRHGKDAPR